MWKQHAKKRQRKSAITRINTIYREDVFAELPYKDIKYSTESQII